MHTDHLNTPRKIAQPSTGTLAWRWDADPFGTAAPNQNPGGLGSFNYNLRFPGQYYQAETGLNQNWNRDYDPIAGRYIESDPTGLDAGVNTYTYVYDSPVDSLDPLGLRVLNPNSYPLGQAILAALWEFNRLIGCDKDIVVTGGNRPATSKLGVGSKSTHVQGIAADIVVPGQVNLETANQAALSGLFGGMGYYEEGYAGPQGEGPHTHVDLRTNGPARWGFPAKGPEMHGYFPRYQTKLNPSSCPCGQ